MKEKGEGVTMCTLLDYAENKGVERGISQGISQGIAQGMERGIQTLIETYEEFGQSYDVTVNKVMEKFQLDSQEAGERMQRYWRS